MGTSAQSDNAKDAAEVLRDEFRHHLELFYAQLKLAPPYHSLEKAVALLATKVKSMEAGERERLMLEPALRWAAYSQAFVDSGLNRKHRGIIVQLRRKPSPPAFPQEYEYFLKTF